MIRDQNGVNGPLAPQEGSGTLDKVSTPSRGTTMSSCGTHRSQLAAGTCRACLGEFCDDCLVYSYGRGKAPYCIRCALVAAGARPDERTLSSAVSA